MTEQPDWSDEDAAAVADDEPEPAGQRARLIIHNAGDIVPAAIPRREWLLGTTFCRKFLSGLVGTGGDGKTAIRYAQYVAAATSRPLTDERVHQRCRVLIVCLEDNLEEVQRRIAAVVVHHGIEPKELDGWLFYCCPRGLKLLLTNPNGARMIGPLLEDLRAAIRHHGIDVAGLDPFVKSHGVEENNNNAIDEVCILLAELGEEFNIAPDLIHHTRKGGSTPGDADRSRGASAAVDAMRLVRTVTRMSDEDAASWGITPQQRVSLIRLDDAKVNLLPRSGDATWFRLIGVPIGNGDNVQTVERWTPPDIWKDLTTATINAILDQIENGPYEDGRYSPSPNAGSARAAWPVLQSFCPSLTEHQAKEIIRTWLKTGVLVKRPHEDPKDRHEHPSLFVGKRPGQTWES